MYLPRSKPGEMKVSPSDFALIEQDIKTMTSRYGDKTEDYLVGNQILVSTNSGPFKSLIIEIIEPVRLKSLDEVSKEEAKCIGNYSMADHVIDFYEIYAHQVTPRREVKGSTGLSVVCFKRIK